MQHVMLPHDIFGSLYACPELFEHLLLGPDGALERYWASNDDLKSAVIWPGDAAWTP